jgi:hypothetical protein
VSVLDTDKRAIIRYAIADDRGRILRLVVILIVIQSPTEAIL